MVDLSTIAVGITCFFIGVVLTLLIEYYNMWIENRKELQKEKRDNRIRQQVLRDLGRDGVVIDG